MLLCLKMLKMSVIFNFYQLLVVDTFQPLCRTQSRFACNRLISSV